MKLAVYPSPGEPYDYEMWVNDECVTLTQMELNSLHELLGKHVKETAVDNWIRKAIEEGIRDREAAEQMLLGWNQHRRFKS